MKQAPLRRVLMLGIACYNLHKHLGGHLFLLFVIGASTFHTVNGMRLIFTESGKGLGKPGRPDYPYHAASLNYKQKSGIWVAILLACVAMLYGGMVLFSKADKGKMSIVD